MTVDIITPETSLFSGEAKSIVLPGIDGELGVLDKHAPLITSLKAGDVRITEANGNKQSIAVKGGTVEVINNTVTILAE